MDVSDDDKVISVELVSDNANNTIAVGTTFGTFKKVTLGTIAKISRARKGVKICDLGDETYNENVVMAEYLEDNADTDVLILDRIGSFAYISTAEIPSDSRTSKGKILKKLGKCQPLAVYVARQPK